MPLSGNTGGSASSNYVRVINQVPSGTNNGGSTGGVWNLIPLNTITHNEGNLISLAANVMTLQPGVYRAFCLHGGFNISANRLRLRDQTNGVNYLGINSNTPNGNDTKSLVAETFSIASASNFVLEMYTLTSRPVVGLGQAQSFPVVPAIDEQYTVAEFIQIGTA